MTALRVSDLQQPGEGRFHRDRQRIVLGDDLAEHVLLLELAARRFGQQEPEDRDDADRNGQQDEHPPPGARPTDPRGEPADDQRAERAGHRPAQAEHAADTPSRRDRVGVGQKRALHRERVRLRRAHAEPSEEQGDTARREAGQRGHQTEEEVREPDDAPTPVPVGEPPHGQRAEDQERRRGGDDEDDRPVAQPERVADVGRQRAHRRDLEVVDGHDRGERGEGHRPATPERLAQRHGPSPMPGITSSPVTRASAIDC